MWDTEQTGAVAERWDQLSGPRVNQLLITKPLILMAGFVSGQNVLTGGSRQSFHYNRPSSGIGATGSCRRWTD